LRLAGLFGHRQGLGLQRHAAHEHLDLALQRLVLGFELADNGGHLLEVLVRLVIELVQLLDEFLIVFAQRLVLDDQHCLRAARAGELLALTLLQQEDRAGRQRLVLHPFLLLQIAHVH